MQILNIVVILLTKLSGWFISRLSLGSGSTWPGHIALYINKNFVKQLLFQSKVRVVLIVGTNGKTTTSKMLRHVLEKKSLKVFQNEEGANLLNGIASTLIRYATLTGMLPYDVAIFEVDENMLPHVLKQITPAAVIILNLFRDQLDRYGEVNSIASKWGKALSDLPKETTMILNGDDPQIYFLGTKLQSKVYYFGLPSKYLTLKEIPHDVDSVYCPVCGEHLIYNGLSYSHLGDFHCGKCGFTRKNVSTYQEDEIQYPMIGTYNIYNTYAVLLTAEKVFSMPISEINSLLHQFKPAYGRQEQIEYQGRKIFMLLSKNPTGFNQSIRAIIEHFGKEEVNVLVLLNDRIPDGRDVSWIWDVEYQDLAAHAKKIFISGDRTYDMALRFFYTFEQLLSVSPLAGLSIGEQFNKVSVIPDYKQAIQQAVQETEAGKYLVVLPTYSAMLEAREVLVGRRIL